MSSLFSILELLSRRIYLQGEPVHYRHLPRVFLNPTERILKIIFVSGSETVPFFKFVFFIFGDFNGKRHLVL
jgi:hypothetical protein